jgi:hypothetical protein
MTVDNVGTDRKRKSGPSLASSGLGAELGGFAVDPRPVTPVTLASPRKRMAGLGGGNGAADGSSAVPLSADTSQQTFLTTPHAWVDN